MKYSIDCLYSYVNEEGITVKRYLLAFKEDDNSKLKNVEFDVEYAKEENKADYIRIIEGESDDLTNEELGAVYYLLDRWAINNI